MRALEEVFVGVPFVGFGFLLRFVACGARSVGFEGDGDAYGGDIERDGDVFDYGFEHGVNPSAFGANRERLSDEREYREGCEYVYGGGSADESRVGDVLGGNVAGKDSGPNGIGAASSGGGKFREQHPNFRDGCGAGGNERGGDGWAGAG